MHCIQSRALIRCCSAAVSLLALLLASTASGAETIGPFSYRIAMMIVRDDAGALYAEFVPEFRQTQSVQRVAAVNLALREKFGTIRALKMLRTGHGQKKYANGVKQDIEVAQYAVKTDKVQEGLVLNVDATVADGRLWLVSYTLMRKVSELPQP
jgi:hypothetical protein